MNRKDTILEFLKDEKFPPVNVEDMMLMLLPLYVEEGKASVTVAIGCTGGKHRSVTFANKLSDTLIKNGYMVNVIHRDIDKKRK